MIGTPSRPPESPQRRTSSIAILGKHPAEQGPCGKPGFHLVFRPVAGPWARGGPVVNDPPLTADPLMVARTAQGESCPGGRGPNGRVGVTPPPQWRVTLQKSVWLGTVHIAVPSARPHPPTLLHSRI